MTRSNLGVTLLAAWALGWAGPARAAGEPSADSLGVQVWEQTLHSLPEAAHRGQPFELHIHLVWGSRTGDETVLPLWHPQKDFQLRGTGYIARSALEPTGTGYAMHAQITYRIEGLREGVRPIDSLAVALVRGGARRVIPFARTAMLVLPAVSPWPPVWAWLAFSAGLVLFFTGWLLARRARRRRLAPRPPSAEELLAGHLAALASRAPSKQALDELLAVVRQEAVRRYGGQWSRRGPEAFREWAKSSSAPAQAHEPIGALASELEAQAYLPADPTAAQWTDWVARARDEFSNTSPAAPGASAPGGPPIGARKER